MRSLVIGGNGFIGSHLVEGLRAEGERVRVLDLGLPRADMDWGDVDYLRGAFSDAAALGPALAEVDTVYHAASTTVPATSNADPIADVEGNLVATLRLLEAMRGAGVRRIVYLSSGGTVYGNPVRLPVDEEHPTDPISSYGIVKLAVEKYLRMHQALHGLSPLILRPANPYGPRQGGGIQGVVAAFFARHRKGEPIRVMGDGSVVRDYMYVTDLARLAVSGGRSRVTGTFNAGSGRGYSLAQVIAAMSAVVGTPMAVEYLPARDFDVHEVVLDIQRAVSVFSWEPQVLLEEGLERTWQWLECASATAAPKDPRGGK